MIKWTVRILIVLVLPFVLVAGWLWDIAEVLFPKEARKMIAEALRNPEETPPGIFLKQWAGKRRAALGEKE